MKHFEFVQAQKAGNLEIEVDRSRALQIASSRILPKRYQAAHIFWSWVWILSIPGAFAVMYFFTWWAGLLLLVFLTPAISSSTKKSAMQFMIDHAVENPEFYEFAVEEGVLQITENNERQNFNQTYESESGKRAEANEKKETNENDYKEDDSGQVNWQKRRLDNEDCSLQVGAQGNKEEKDEFDFSEPEDEIEYEKRMKREKRGDSVKKKSWESYMNAIVILLISFFSLSILLFLWHDKPVPTKTKNIPTQSPPKKELSKTINLESPPIQPKPPSPIKDEKEEKDKLSIELEEFPPITELPDQQVNEPLPEEDQNKTPPYKPRSTLQTEEGFIFNVPSGWEIIPEEKLNDYPGVKGSGIKYGLRKYQQSMLKPYTYMAIKIINDSNNEERFLETKEALTIDTVRLIETPNFTYLGKEILGNEYVDLGRKIQWRVLRSGNELEYINLIADIFKEKKMITVHGIFLDSHFDQLRGDFVNIVKSVRSNDR